MATFIVIDRIMSILTVLIICGFAVKMYVEFTETCNKRKFVIYGLALIVGIATFIYNLGRTVILWLY